MQEFVSSYPVKLLSRVLPAARTNKLRISWFVVGTAFGIGCACALTPTFSGSFHFAQTATPAPEVKVAEAPLAAPQQLAELAPASGEKAPETSYPLALDIKVESGDTLISLLTDAGVSYDEAQNVIDSIKKVYDPKKLDIGKNIEVTLDKTGDKNAKPIISSMSLPVSGATTIQVTRVASGFEVKKVDAPVSRKVARAGGRIDSSLYETGMDAGIPAALLAEIISAYSYDVDFQRDIKQGDAMDVMYERMETDSGAAVGSGKVIYADLELGGRTLRIYRYEDASGHAEYYTEKGESIRKALLRTPINGAKITSGYGMRMHPLLGYSKMHRGVDFGAPIGTPIYASGDGVIEFVGRKGGYGNYIKIKHNDKYASAYGHISRFAANMRPGTRVHQGQVIAYVGMTGMATGPHLHYEILINNEQVNPSNVKFKTGNILSAKDMTHFRATVKDIQTELASLPKNGGAVAMNDGEKKPVIN